jgi:hypothetical protein
VKNDIDLEAKRQSWPSQRKATAVPTRMRTFIKGLSPRIYKMCTVGEIIKMRQACTHTPEEESQQQPVQVYIR